MVRSIIYIFLIAFLFNIGLFGQGSKDFLSIGVTPTYLLDPITTSVSISVEKQIVPKVNAALMYGFDPKIDFLSWDPDPLSNHHEYKLFLKYLFFEDEIHGFGIYVGLDYFGNHKEYRKTNDSYIQEGIAYDYSKAKVIRSVNGSRINHGLKKRIFKNFWLDLYSGFGMKYVDIKYFPENVMVREYPIIDEWLTPLDRNAGGKWRIALIVGLKLEYRIL